MRIVYLYDTLCGWCMVASPEINKLATQLPDTISLTRLHVNLFDEHYSPEINSAFLDKVQQVGFKIAPQKTGVRFSEAYLELLQSANFTLQSKNSALAVTAALTVSPKKADRFASMLQEKHFLQGLNPNTPEVATETAKDLGIDIQQYQLAYNNPETHQHMEENRQAGRQLMQQSGGGGVPQLLALHDATLYPLDPYDAEASLKLINNLSPLKHQS